MLTVGDAGCSDPLRARPVAAVKKRWRTLNDREDPRRASGRKHGELECRAPIHATPVADRTVGPGRVEAGARRSPPALSPSEAAFEPEELPVSKSAARPSSPRASPAESPWLALGASTGGPIAVCELLTAVSRLRLARVVLVQHISGGFEGELAEWLAALLHRDVRVAIDGEHPPLGAVRLAPTGSHLVVSGAGALVLEPEGPPRSGHRPSIDELFLSLARVAPARTAAVLLSGMGRDGATGLHALRRAGAFCLSQNDASATAYGMPRAARALGASKLSLAPTALGAEIDEWLARPLPGLA